MREEREMVRRERHTKAFALGRRVNPVMIPRIAAPPRRQPAAKRPQSELILPSSTNVRMIIAAAIHWKERCEQNVLRRSAEWERERERESSEMRCCVCKKEIKIWRIRGGIKRRGKHTPRRTEPRRIHGRSLLSAGLSYTAYLGCATATGWTTVVAGYTDCVRAGEDLIPCTLDIVVVLMCWRLESFVVGGWWRGHV